MNPECRLNHASPLKRLAATAIDLGILTVILIPLLIAISQGGMESPWPYILNALPAWLLVAGGNLYILDSSGQTFGKRLMKIRIVALDGSRAPFFKLLFIRYLPFALTLSIPYIGPLVMAALAVTVFRNGQQGFHDRLAGTYVIRT
ncbi:MAG: RDD family protein [Candidatus Sedimenticola sp. 6PFRAG7]